MIGFHEDKRQQTGGDVSLTGSLVGADGAARAQCTVLASNRSFALDVETVDSHMQVNIRVQSVDYGLSLPVGAGDIRVDGAVIANYVSCGCFKPVKGECVRVLRDDARRRFLWARVHGCTYGEAARYAYRREALLVCGRTVLASFAGYHKKDAPFFTPRDQAELEKLPPQERWCVLALCLMHNLYGADRALYHTNPQREQVQESLLGKPIPDIPSFVPAQGGRISIDPADVQGGIRWRDRFLQFISSKYQYTVGIPFYIMTIPLVRQLVATPSPNAWGTPEWIVAALWCALLLLFLKYLFFPGYRSSTIDDLERPRKVTENIFIHRASRNFTEK